MSQLSSSRCTSFAVIAFGDTGVVTSGGVTYLARLPEHRAPIAVAAPRTPLQSEPTANDQPKPMAERPADGRTRDTDRCL
jgi:hypothetical protein